VEDEDMTGATPISGRIAGFAAAFGYDTIPESVRTRARHLMLDALGIALASSRFDFAHRTFSALAELGGAGDAVVLGFSTRLPLRDAVLMNGLLAHGLDYDDTHVPGVIHVTASGFPLALGLAAHLDRSGRDLLAAYVLGVEVSARLASVARGGFHRIGFHPTGLINAFGCTVAAGFLHGLSAAQLAMAQGIALSMASGSLEFLEDGAWTKRLHPGWAAVAGITAAALARAGFVGPGAAYEGRFGLYRSHLGGTADGCNWALATRGLGSVWELDEVAVKPFPACHLAHACADAALELRKQGARPDNIAKLTALVPQETVAAVCEPVQNKRRPASAYDAQFSVPYIVATCLARGRFGLAELDERTLRDPEILALADRVEYAIDPASGFPKCYSGELIARLADGRELRHREHVNRGAADRPISNEEVVTKFMDNAGLAVSPSRAERLRDALLAVDQIPRARAFASALGA
jgi:2-methylcitrate dehydratase PrpD